MARRNWEHPLWCNNTLNWLTHLEVMPKRVQWQRKGRREDGERTLYPVLRLIPCASLRNWGGLCISCCQGWLRQGRIGHPLSPEEGEGWRGGERRRGGGWWGRGGEGEREELPFIISLLCARGSASPDRNGSELHKYYLLWSLRPPTL